MAVAMLAGSSWAAVACTPAPPPTLCPHLLTGVNLHDFFNQGVRHLDVNAVMCVTPYGDTTTVTGSQSDSGYGFIGAFGPYDANPLGIYGPTAQGVNIRGWYDYSKGFIASWDITATGAIGGLGVRNVVAKCVVVFPVVVVSGGGQVASQIFLNRAAMHTDRPNLACEGGGGWKVSYAS